jgi:hypothetical protein
MTLREWLASGITNPWPYQQNDLITMTREKLPSLPDPGGVCFRLSFKWLACKIYERPFKFDITQVKGEKIVAKQLGYLNDIAPYEKVMGPSGAFRGDPYYRFFTSVDRISVGKLNEWGQKTAKGGGGSKYNLRFRSVHRKSLPEAREFQVDAQFVIGVYGTMGPKRFPWAHATAFYRKGEKVLYFDSNGGEFTLDPKDDAGALIATDLRRYGTPPYSISEYALYLAEDR